MQKNRCRLDGPQAAAVIWTHQKLYFARYWMYGNILYELFCNRLLTSVMSENLYPLMYKQKNLFRFFLFLTDGCCVLQFPSLAAYPKAQRTVLKSSHKWSAPVVLWQFRTSVGCLCRAATLKFYLHPSTCHIWHPVDNLLLCPHAKCSMI